MRVYTNTGATSYEFKVNKSLAMLQLDITGASVDTTTIKAKIVVTSNSGKDKYIADDVELEVLGRFGVIGLGYNVNYEKAAGGSITRAIRNILIGNHANYALLKDEELKIELTGMNAADTVTVYGIQVGGTTTEAASYDILDIDGAVNARNYDVTGYDYAILDSSKITKLRGESARGGAFEDILIEELKNTQIMIDDINLKYISDDDTLARDVSIYKGYVVLPLNQISGDKIVNLVITSSNSSDIWLQKFAELDERNPTPRRAIADFKPRVTNINNLVS